MADSAQLQVSTRTKANRHPLIFARAKHLVRRRRRFDAKILSFGCSEGLESVTLAQIFDRGDRITGVDINQAALNLARRDNTHPRVRYLHADDFTEDRTKFDAIFAMSVLCRWPETETGDVKKFFPFSLFDQVCRDLDSRLSKGGVLVVHNANYRFTDLPIADRYIAASDQTHDAGFVRMFTPAGEPLQTPSHNSIFVKRAMA